MSDSKHIWASASLLNLLLQLMYPIHFILQQATEEHEER